MFTRKTTRPTSPLEVLSTLANVRSGPDMLTVVIPEGHALVSAMVDRGVVPARIGVLSPLSTATEAMIGKVYSFGYQELEHVRAIVADPSVPMEKRDAVAAVQWMHAEAGFALGLALGMRLGGGR